MSESVEKNQVDIFNFLRVFALFCVLMPHSKMIISGVYSPVISNYDWGWIFHTPAWSAMGMFFLLSGYLIGKGFYNGKYKTDKHGILSFYYTRIIRIVPMYLLFILFVFLFINPQWFLADGAQALPRLLTFTYNGNIGIAGIGALWFISTIFQLYLLTPFVYKFVLKKFEKYNILLIFLLLVFGLLYRFVIKYIGLDWHSFTYTSFLGNVDYFFAGMLMNSVTQKSGDNSFKRFLRPVSLILLFLFTISMIMYSLVNNFIMYKYLAPTIITVIFLVIFYAWDYEGRVRCAKLTIKNIIKNPLRIIEYLSILSFGIYLYHSNFFSIAPTILLNTDMLNGKIHVGGQDMIFIYGFSAIILILWCSVLYFIIEKPISLKYRKEAER